VAGPMRVDRVVYGVFLGWTQKPIQERHFYVRRLKDSRLANIGTRLEVALPFYVGLACRGVARAATFRRFNQLQAGARYGWNVLFMTFLQHMLRKLVSCAEMSVTRGTKITELCCGASEHVSGAPPRHGTTGGSRCLFNGRTRRQGRISQGATAPAAWRCWRRCAEPRGGSD